MESSKFTLKTCFPAEYVKFESHHSYPCHKEKNEQAEKQSFFLGHARGLRSEQTTTPKSGETGESMES